ncbi:MAG: MBL fold metallo-hydrolase, partial [Chloroflexota bacterium]
APGDVDRILSQLEGTNLQYILMTHADSDHIAVLPQLREATGAPVGIHASEPIPLQQPPDFLIEDGQIIRFGNVELRSIYTPGHTPGSMSFVTGDILIDGDTLFPGGPGNTQRPGGDFDQIINSIRTKLFVLPDATRVYPGHGKPTTIGAEKPHIEEWMARGY